jgi:hypothetical protein
MIKMIAIAGSILLLADAIEPPPLEFPKLLQNPLLHTTPPRCIFILKTNNQEICIEPDGDIEITGGTITDAASEFYKALQPMLANCRPLPGDRPWK